MAKVRNKYIYCLYLNDTMDVVYVGCSQNPEDRFRRHLYTGFKEVRDRLSLQVIQRTGLKRASQFESVWMLNFLNLGCALRNVNNLYVRRGTRLEFPIDPSESEEAK